MSLASALESSGWLVRSFCATLLLQPAALMDDALLISAFDHVIIMHLHASLMIFIVCELASLHSAGLVTIYKSASTVCSLVY